MGDSNESFDQPDWNAIRGAIMARLRRDGMKLAKERCDFQAAYTAGNDNAILHAVAEAALAGEKLPDWAAKAYLEKFFCVAGADAESWDEVFGKPHAPRTNFKAIQKWNRLAWPVFSSVEKLRREDFPIDKALALAASEHLISTSTARDYYYKVRREFLAGF